MMPVPFVELAESLQSVNPDWEFSAAFSPEDISVHRAGFGVGLTSALAESHLSALIKRVLNCPALAADFFCRNIHRANYLYFAFSGIDRPEYKIYFEYPVLLSEKIGGVRRWGPPAVQLHALKWIVQQPEATRESVYLRHPGLTVSELISNLSGDHSLFCVALIRDYLESIAPGSCQNPEKIDILSVHDGFEGKAYAWDLRLYDFSISVRQLSPVILAWAGQVIPNEVHLVRQWIKKHADQTVGHISVSSQKLHVYFCSKD
jgi:hypothetical protein